MENKGFWKEAFQFSKYGCCHFCYKVENKADWFDACPQCREQWGLWVARVPNKQRGALSRWAKAKVIAEEKRIAEEMEKDCIEHCIEEAGLAQDWLPEYDDE